MGIKISVKIPSEIELCAIDLKRIWESLKDKRQDNRHVWHSQDIICEGIKMGLINLETDCELDFTNYETECGKTGSVIIDCNWETRTRGIK